MGRELGLKIELFEGHIVAFPTMWRKALVASHYLSERQMLRAARRYRLGATRQQGVIFWQIDDHDAIHDGKVMYYLPDCHRDKGRHPTWVSTLLVRRDPFPNAPHETSHCLFGLHLLSYATARTVAIVEAEKSAVILSELYPQSIWLATGGLGNIQADKFRPLRGHKVILFPDTDPAADGMRQRNSSCNSPSGRTLLPSASLPFSSSMPQRSRKAVKSTSSITSSNRSECHTEITESTEKCPRLPASAALPALASAALPALASAALPSHVGNCEEGAIGERSDGGAKPGWGWGQYLPR